jgi:NTP pyrophosphatase (non-canonical NTP hydrolase)
MIEEGLKEVARLCVGDSHITDELTFNEYSCEAIKTAICPKDMDILYPLIGLTGETGEVAEKIKKVYRDNDGYFDPLVRMEILKELGDCLWYINKMCIDLGFTFEDCALFNLDKIRKRKEQDKLHGNGDNR